MDKPVRVLLTDDSVVIRRVFSVCLAEDPEIEIVAMAENGKKGVEAASQHDIDVVIMDVEMPVMDGIEATAAIRKQDPHLPIVMFSSITSKGARATMDALSAGASDYLAKPSSVGQVADAMSVLRETLIPKIKGWGRRYQRQTGRSVVTRQSRLSTGVPKPGLKAGAKADIVAIGISTGGPDALAQVLPAIPGDFDTPIVIVQHMPPVFTGLLAERLDKVCPLSVCEAAEGNIVSGGGVWIAPGGQHMTLRNENDQTVVRLQDGPPVQSCKPAVDVLFKSVAERFGNSVLGVVMTGMGQDGRDGSQVIKKAGGQVVIQDEDTSVVWGMPGAVSQASLANAEYPLEEIAGVIVENAGNSASKPAAQLAGCR